MNHFPTIEAFTNAEFAKLGYTPRWVSVFHRWLTEGEAAASTVMTYDIAEQAGSSAEYLLGEAKLLAFYGRLFREGAIQYVAPQRDEMPPPIMQHATFDGALSEAVVASLREQRLGDLIDCYIPHRSLRIVGGYDRTDLLLFENSPIIAGVEQMARDCGVFILT